MFGILFLIPRLVVLKMIKIYQKIFSPDHGLWKVAHPHGYCRFKPTCSEFGYEAIARYGIIKGGWLAMGRLIRCNPWNKGGWDSVK